MFPRFWNCTLATDCRCRQPRNFKKRTIPDGTDERYSVEERRCPVTWASARCPEHRGCRASPRAGIAAKYSGKGATTSSIGSPSTIAWPPSLPGNYLNRRLGVVLLDGSLCDGFDFGGRLPDCRLLERPVIYFMDGFRRAIGMIEDRSVGGGGQRKGSGGTSLRLRFVHPDQATGGLGTEKMRGIELAVRDAAAESGFQRRASLFGKFAGHQRRNPRIVA